MTDTSVKRYITDERALINTNSNNTYMYRLSTYMYLGDSLHILVMKLEMLPLWLCKLLPCNSIEIVEIKFELCILGSHLIYLIGIKVLKQHYPYIVKINI